MARLFRRMVVAGVGLIGGSLALAARKEGLVTEVIGYGRAEKSLRWAEKRGIVDSYFLDERDFPEGVDLLMLATPVRATVPTANSFLPGLEPGCLVSDVGSVKARIVRDMERLLPSRMPFVGGHPIAGGEQWGAQSAAPGLFYGRRCILTPTRRTDPGALKKIARLWRGVGARVEVMSPSLHDKILAVVSHLPHVLVYALVNILGRTRPESVDLKAYCAGGFKDFTRIASSRPELWRDICLLNGEAIGRSLSDYIDSLERLKIWIEDGRGALLEREFTRANDIRSRIP